MTTIDDQATEREELDRAIAMQQRKPQLDAVGYCHNCSEECNGCFCCPECRDDFMQRERFNR